MRYVWDSDRTAMPRLIVGRTYKLRRGGSLTIGAVKTARMSAHGGLYYQVLDDVGALLYEQNDFALLNKLDPVDVARDPPLGIPLDLPGLLT